MTRRCFLPTALASAAWASAEPDYRLALPGYRYEFPRDHFAHPDFRTEWWYYTGNVSAVGGGRYGFELVFFRQGRKPDPRHARSSWGGDQIYLAHLALTDAGRGRFSAHKRLNRAGPGLAGASFAERRVWNGNWSSVWEGERQTLTAIADDFRFRLELTPVKPPVIHGVNGVSQKAAGAGKASHYVSFSRLRVDGQIETDAGTARVAGTAWMDHEWFTHQLEATQIGWDWFSAQLDGSRELMLFQLRQRGGGIDPFSAGTYIGPDGRARHLERDEFSLTPLRRWRSPRTRAAYPVEWRVRVPALSLDLTARAVLDAQELAGGSDEPTYWEGAVDYQGSAAGVGYLEMTGYDRPIRLD